MEKKVLIIRFSSFGDIIQSLSSVTFLKTCCDNYQVYFLTKKEFASVVGVHPDVNEIWKYDRTTGLTGLFKIALEIKKHDFDIIYDAHATLRTRILKVFLRIISFNFSFEWIKRPKNRWKRFQFFTLKKRDVFELPFQGALSYVRPVQPLGNPSEVFQFNSFVSWSFTKQMEADLFSRFLEKILPEQHFITLAPSAAWEMKRWPLDYWKKLIEILPNFQFLVLGGPGDHFCQEITDVAPLRVINTAGRTSLLESCCLVFLSEFVISGDTGILHVADLFHIDGVALLGPTAFGHPTGDSLEVLETGISCSPCTKDGRGKCRDSVYQKCLVDIKPDHVASRVNKFFKDLPHNTNHRIS